MKRSTVWAALTLMILALGCSSISINHDWDRDADFPGYRTFDWMPRQQAAPQSAQQAMRSNDLLDKRVRSSVDRHLGGKGLTKDMGGSPDLWVVYHTGLQDKINVTDWGYRYSYDYWGWGGRDIDVYQYTEGTLVIDLIDTKTQELVWRGSATKTLDSAPKPEKMDQNIDDAVRKILSNYPPKQR